jgi:hypothetical protein
MIVALGRDGVRALRAFSGATDAPVFPTDVEQVPAPTWHPGVVAVFDNLRPHQSAAVTASIEQGTVHRGMARPGREDRVPGVPRPGK